jgi:short-subunit dehydrogenase
MAVLNLLERQPTTPDNHKAITMKILVTGASSGIGNQLVKQLSAMGHQVFATARNVDSLEALAAKTGCLYACYDLAESLQVEKLYAQARSELGGLDVLINNAGMNARKCPIEEFTFEELDQSYAINLRAPMLLSKLALTDMKVQRSGYIINVTSTVVKRASETMSVYTAMKQGLSGFTGVLMKEAQPFGVRVTNLIPGGTDTNFRAADRPEYMSPEGVAKTITTLFDLPSDVVIHELTFRPMVEVE